jgi:hypothetical protein
MDRETVERIWSAADLTRGRYAWVELLAQRVDPYEPVQTRGGGD